MPQHRIKYGDASQVLKTQLPDEFGDVTSGGVLITNKSSETLDSGSLAIAAATTLNGAVSAGAKAAVFTAVTGYAVGDVVRLGGTTGIDNVIIKGIDTSTKVVTFGDYLTSAHPDEASVNCRNISYTLDASTVATWTAGLEVQIIWGVDSDGNPNFDTDDAPHKELGFVVKRAPTFAGLEEKFRQTYPHYATKFGDMQWDFVRDLAWDELRNLFMNRGRDIDSIVDTTSLEPTMMLQIAYHIASTGDSSWQDEFARMEVRLKNSVEGYASRLIWEDSNQDDSEDDEELATAVKPLPRRSFFGM